ncbi:MAG: site-specific DNA-methyltransferase [Spirochaetes bacterium]|nr:site-specific DNA-methyltransferase [Spirochaetota bacterium]
MLTRHNTLIGDCRKMRSLLDESVQLVVTSPPYPMIAMWDELFASMNPEIDALRETSPEKAFEKMHGLLDEVWLESYRVLSPGGFCCVNIGDATRSLNGRFRLFSNHSRITQKCTEIGFTNLPPVIWRKPTNAPNKFMGSGMLPAGAYITYEHEYVLVLRKGGKREFSNAEQNQARNASAYFWEERNVWFSDLWLLTGARQSLAKAARLRSAAFPLELPYRLIQMYSVYGDRVLDPFMGTGTTTVAAIISGRNSTGYEIDAGIMPRYESKALSEIAELGNKMLEERLSRHRLFIEERISAGKSVKHRNELYGFPVITAQERQARFFKIAEIEWVGKELQVAYDEIEKKYLRASA